jgi:hypothetical protein
LRKAIPVMLLITLFVLSSLAAVAAAKPAQKQEIGKVVFIHYREMPSQPDWVPSRGGKEEGNGGYRLLKGGVKWADEDLPVKYSINPAGSGFGENAINAIFMAFETWDAEVAKEIFDNVVEITDRSGTLRDDNNTVSWAYIDDERIVAQCTIWYYINTKEMVEFDIVFNTQQPWGIDQDGEENVYELTNAFDIQNIATHESGHTLVLLDLYKDQDSEMTMYGYTTIGEVKKRSLAWGDINGVNELYGA